MSAGKIVLLVFGVIVLLVSFGLIAGGGVIIWANNTIKDSEGFYTTDTVQLERDSYAIVTPTADIDLKTAWLWDWDDLATFKIEGSNNDSAKQIFIGVADESDVKAYLSGVEYDEITQFDIYPTEVDYSHHTGISEPIIPTSETFWTASTHGAGTQTLELELETGNHVLVLMNTDGSAGVDLSTVVGAKVPMLIWVGVGLLAGGVVVLTIGSLMVYFSVRRS
jgi:hypothetical protein